jgi:uncharacterized protein DUF1877
MSMIGKFARTPSDRLKQIIADPELVTGVFDGSNAEASLTSQMQSVLAKNDPRNNEMMRRASQVLTSSIRSMDPRMSELVKKSLQAAGINPEELAGGGAGAKLIELMRQRAHVMQTGLQSAGTGNPAGGAKPSQPGAVISIDKAWHGVHYLMCGAPDSGSAMLSQVVMGGTEVGEDLGYGPARFFEADRVVEIVRELTRAGLESEMQARFDPTAMTAAGIYPNGWSPGDLNWVLDEFRKLRQFFIDASAAKDAVLTVIE